MVIIKKLYNKIMQNNIFEKTYKDRLSNETKRLLGSMENYIQNIIKKELKAFDTYIDEKLADTEDNSIEEKDVESQRKKFYERIKNRLFKILQEAFMHNSNDIQQAFILKLYPECFECDHNWDGPPQINKHAPEDAKILIFPDLTKEQKNTINETESIVDKEDNVESENKENPKLGPFKDTMNKKLSVYFGQYNQGKKEGLGKMYLEDGYYQEGYWKDNVPSGKQKCIHPKGTSFEGEVNGNSFKGFIQNIKETSSPQEPEKETICTNEKTERDPEKEPDIKKSDHIVTDKNNDANFSPDEKQSKTEQDIDNFIKGKSKVIGFAFNKDGSKYEGEFFKNRREGYGELYDKEGGVFKGFWLDNQKSGKGYYIDPGSNLYEEKWDNGKLISRVKIFVATSRKTK